MPAVSYNYHTHSTYCDGNNSLRDMVEEALGLGMTEIGFSGHSYTPIDESYCIIRDKMSEYYSEVGALKEEFSGGPSAGSESVLAAGLKYGPAASGEEAARADAAPHIKIYRGIEMDYFSGRENYRFDWDHIICSCHYIQKNGNIFSVDDSEEILLDACERYYNGDIYSLIEDYYTEVGNVADVVRAGCITEGTSADAKMIVGHFDLITKFNEGGRLFDESDPRYVKAWKGALDRLTSGASGCISSSGCNSASSLDYGQLVFEINTGAMSRGYRTSPYPSREILIEIARRGIPVILSSDSHDVSTLMYGFDEAYHLAAECGARVLTSLFDQTCVCPAES